MIRSRIFFPLFFSIFIIGCASTSKTVTRPQAPGESRAQVVSAMEHVLGAVSGKTIDEKDLRKLNNDIAKDPEAKSAVQTISNAVSGQGPGVRYCPVDGERYSPKFAECPVHHVPLKILTQ